MEQWISFIDRRGPGYAQPDAYVVFDSHVVCVECKLTQCDEGLTQISQLYRPLLTAIYKRPVLGVLACRNIVRDPGRYLLRSLERVVGTVSEDIYTWHWNGR